MSSKTYAVVLSGCGVKDGSEIHESVLTLLAIDRAGATYQCFAPNIDQLHVVNHLTGDQMDGTRNVLVESARIARGKVKDLKEYRAADYDGLILPGGFGAAKNLSDFAEKGAGLTVQAGVERALTETHDAGKPIGALCIAPTILAKVFPGAELTIGQDQGTAAIVEQLGARHKISGHGEAIVDQQKKFVTTPCYMLDATIAQVADGATAVVTAMMTLA